MAAYNWPGGIADRAYLLARTDVVELHVSTFKLDEVARVLAEKFGWEEDRVGRAVAQVRRVAIKVHEPEESIDVIALAAGAQTLVTGDTRSTCCPSAPSTAFLSSS